MALRWRDGLCEDCRLWAKVDASGDCWEWTGARTSGYGHLRMSEGVYRRAHRVVYERMVGPIPEGLTIDHRCRNKACVNPDHLEPVTNQENLRRTPKQLFNHTPLARVARGATHWSQTRTECAKGHPLPPPGPGPRPCRTCRRASFRSYRDRQRAVA